MTSLHSRSFTPYQKRIIKAVTDLIGSRAFSARKAQNNHLELKIEGIEKPLYTGATPSDCKAFENFMSQLRGMLRASEESVSIEQACHQAVCTTETEHCPFEKIVKGMVKNYRNTLEAMIQKETDWILAEGSVEGLAKSREQRVKDDFNRILASKKSIEYVKAAQIRCVTEELLHHLNFMLPSTAYYADLLQAQTAELDTPQPAAVPSNEATHTEIESETQPNTGAFSLGQFMTGTYQKMPKKPKKWKSKITRLSMHTTGEKPQPSPKEKTPAPQPVAPLLTAESACESLMALPEKTRITQFKNLGQKGMSALIEELQFALAEQHEEDLCEVIALIQAKGLEVAEIAARMKHT